MKQEPRDASLEGILGRSRPRGRQAGQLRQLAGARGEAGVHRRGLPALSDTGQRARWRRTASRFAHFGEQYRWRPLRDVSA
ncbi:hypothetical protein OPAG_00999 [Rhodococcus opacus PD630]|nr:hypothetical protein OPAG_00999 [Rhodococcus opacus PD630]